MTRFKSNSQLPPGFWPARRNRFPIGPRKRCGCFADHHNYICQELGELHYPYAEPPPWEKPIRLCEHGGDIRTCPAERGWTA